MVSSDHVTWLFVVLVWMWFSLCFSSPVECYSMDSWCWLWSRCPLWKTYSETHYRLCEWRMTNEVNLTADGCFFLAVSHPPPAAQRRRRFTRTTWSRCGATKRTRRGHAPPRLKPLLLLSTLHPEWTTASWTHMRAHTQTRTNNVIYYGFNLLLWMNQGHRLALCSVQCSLQPRDKKNAFPACANFSVVSKTHVLTESKQIISLFFSMNFFKPPRMLESKCLHQQRYKISFSFPSETHGIFKWLNLQAFLTVRYSFGFENSNHDPDPQFFSLLMVLYYAHFERGKVF